MPSSKQSTPSWSVVKTQLTDFDHAGLVSLVRDLYAASKDNQAFLHARFDLGVGDDMNDLMTASGYEARSR